MMTIKEAIGAWFSYALKKSLITKEKLQIITPKILDIYHIDDLKLNQAEDIVFEVFMTILLDEAYRLNLFGPNTIDERDAFEAKLMDMVMPTPFEVKQRFKTLYTKESSLSTNYLYQLSQDVNYIKTTRLKENMPWTYSSDYGDLALTINLAKPEKDPKAIAEALKMPVKKIDHVPLCVLCKENEQNYYNARMHLRIVPITLGDESWHFQYSPYLYYKEHAIILHDTHRPMKISEKTFVYLFDFIDQFPHYFIGSNADLPIVGGSILNHDHFQAGRHHFPIEYAKTLQVFNHPDLCIEHIKWPLSTIRLTSDKRDVLIKWATRIFHKWRVYNNPSLEIISHTEDTPHNTITPILRKKEQAYQLDLILRNNRTNPTYPDGIFHPHKDVHHIKKENIGLIEAMGLAILPGRLKDELEWILSHKTNDELPEHMKKHAHWISSFKDKHITQDMLYHEVGQIFEHVMENAGVFKQNDEGVHAMKQFIESL